MKKSLCALWLLILLPFGLVQAAEFKLTGRTSWQLGQLMVNGIPFVIDEQTRFKDGLDEDDLGGTWVDLEGVIEGDRRLVREVEPLEDFENPVREFRVEAGSVITDGQEIAAVFRGAACDGDGRVFHPCGEFHGVVEEIPESDTETLRIRLYPCGLFADHRG